MDDSPAPLRVRVSRPLSFLIVDSVVSWLLQTKKMSVPLYHRIRTTYQKRNAEFLVFELAFLIRFLYCMARQWIDGDAPEYLDIAKNLRLHGAFAFTGPNGELVETAFRPPLYPFFLALVGGDPFTAFLLQAILGAATVVLVFKIADQHIGRKPAVLSAFLISLAPLTVHYTAGLMTETLFTFLVVLACYFWSKSNYWAAGAVFGLVALTRPIAFPFLALILILALTIPALRKNLKQYAILIGIALAVSSFWIIRNSVLTGTFTLTQSSGYGTNLLFGTIRIPLWGDDVWSWITKDPLTQPVPGLSDVQMDRFRMRLAVSRIQEQPVEYLQTRARQYPRLFFDSGDYLLGSLNEAIGSSTGPNHDFVIAYKVVFVGLTLTFYLLALYGMYLLRSSLLALPFIFVYPIFLALQHLPMWIETRYYLSAVPFLCIFTAKAVMSVLGRFGYAN